MISNRQSTSHHFLTRLHQLCTLIQQNVLSERRVRLGKDVGKGKERLTSTAETIVASFEPGTVSAWSNFPLVRFHKHMVEFGAEPNIKLNSGEMAKAGTTDGPESSKWMVKLVGGVIT